MRKNQNVVMLTNLKGGIGKSTMTRELGYFCASGKRNTLIIDCDFQGSITQGLLGEDCEQGTYEALTGKPFEILPITDHLSLLAVDMKLSSLEQEATGKERSLRIMTTFFLILRHRFPWYF